MHWLVNVLSEQYRPAGAGGRVEQREPEGSWAERIGHGAGQADWVQEGSRFGGNTGSILTPFPGPIHLHD